MMVGINFFIHMSLHALPLQRRCVIGPAHSPNFGQFIKTTQLCAFFAHARWLPIWPYCRPPPFAVKRVFAAFNSQPAS